MIVLDASAAIDLARKASNAEAIAADLAREAPAAMPAHFEADAYAGVRHMVGRRALSRDRVREILDRMSEIPGSRSALAPLLSAAHSLFDQVGAHDSFYVVLALAHRAPLLTSDGALARAAESLGVKVLFRPLAAGER